MEIESNEEDNNKSLKIIRDKSRLNSSGNLLHAWDILLCIFYFIMSYCWDYEHLANEDAQFFVGLWMFSIVLAQILLTLFGWSSRLVKNDDDLKKWIFLRRFHHIILALLFLFDFISGYHELYGIIIFWLSIPIQFFLTGVWKSSILIEEVEEKSTLFNNSAPSRFGVTGFEKFDDEK